MTADRSLRYNLKEEKAVLNHPKYKEMKYNYNSPIKSN